MNKKMILRTTLPVCFALALVWAMLALSGNSLAKPPEGKGGGKKKGGGVGTIAVTVAFRDFQGDDADPVPDRLMSDCRDCQATCDCLSPYIHKVEKVSTGIGSSGNFFMKLTKGNQPAIRTLFFDFSDCVEGPCTPPFDFGFSVWGTNLFTSGINLREMFVGEVRDDLSLVVALNLTRAGGGLWQLFFDPSDVRCSGSTSITVRRIDADTWEIEAGLTDVACLAELGGGGDFLFSGLYRMPFKMTVQKK